MRLIGRATSSGLASFNASDTGHRLNGFLGCTARTRVIGAGTRLLSRPTGGRNS